MSPSELLSQNPQLDIRDILNTGLSGLSESEFSKFLNLTMANSYDILALLKLINSGAEGITPITTAALFASLNTLDFNDGLYKITDQFGVDGGLIVRVVSDINGVQSVETTANGVFWNPDYQFNGTYNADAILAKTGVSWSGNRPTIFQSTSGSINYFPKVTFNITNTSADFTVNGGFIVDASGWTLGANATYDPINPGVLFSDVSTLGQNAPITNSGTYTVAFTVYGYVSGAITPVLGGVAGTPITANGPQTQTFVAGFTGTNQLAFNVDAGSVLGITDITCTAVIAIGDAGNTPGSTFIVIDTDNTTFMDVRITGGDCAPDATLLDDVSGAVANITAQVVTQFGVGDSISAVTNTGTAIIVSDSPNAGNGTSPGTLFVKNINLLFAAGNEIQDSNGHIAYMNGGLSYSYSVGQGDIVIAVDNWFGNGVFMYIKTTADITSRDPSTDFTNYAILTDTNNPDGKRLPDYGYVPAVARVDLQVYSSQIRLETIYSMTDGFNYYNNRVNVSYVENFPFGNSRIYDCDFTNDHGSYFGNYRGQIGNVVCAGSLYMGNGNASIYNGNYSAGCYADFSAVTDGSEWDSPTAEQYVYIVYTNGLSPIDSERVNPINSNMPRNFTLSGGVLDPNINQNYFTGIIQVTQSGEITTIDNTYQLSSYFIIKPVNGSINTLVWSHLINIRANISTKATLSGITLNAANGDYMECYTDGSGNVYITNIVSTGDLKQQTARVAYDWQAADTTAGFAVVAVAFDTPFADTNYTPVFSITDTIGDADNNGFWVRDIHNITAAGFNAVFSIYSPGTPPTNNSIVVNAIAIHD